MDKIRLKIESFLFIILTLSVLFLLNNCTSDLTKKLGDGYIYRNEGGTIKEIYCESPNGGEIPATVVEYVYDNKFIIAKQMPKIPHDLLYEKTYVYSNGIDNFYYWLIIKGENVVFGPLSMTELDSIRTKYNVPKKLTLE